MKAFLSLGDNDYLASLVVKLIRADLLVILSTVDGLLDMSAAPHRRISCIPKITPEVLQLINPPTSGGISKGGMSSKLKSAENAVHAGCTVVIADGRKAGRLTDVMAGKDVGTLLPGATM